MTEKRFTILYETEKNPMEWDLIDNQKDCLIVTGNGKAICDLLNELNNENEQLKKQIERIDFILDDLNSAEYISRDDGIKALNKIDKVIGKR